MNMPSTQKKKKSNLFCKVERNEIWLTKNQICFVKDKKEKKKEKGFG